MRNKTTQLSIGFIEMQESLLEGILNQVEGQGWSKQDLDHLMILISLPIISLATQWHLYFSNTLHKLYWPKFRVPPFSIHLQEH